PRGNAYREAQLAWRRMTRFQADSKRRPGRTLRLKPDFSSLGLRRPSGTRRGPERSGPRLFYGELAEEITPQLMAELLACLGVAMLARPALAPAGNPDV